MKNAVQVVLTHKSLQSGWNRPTFSRCCLVAALLTLTISLAPCRADTATATTPAYGSGNFATDLTMAGHDFMQGEVSNILCVAGANYLEKSHQVGGELYLGYNIPKLASLPLEPRIVPFAGISWMGKSFNGVSGTATLKADLHPLRFFDGGKTNGLAHDFTLTPYGVAGVMQNISGETFGSFIVPGKKALNGQGTGAITGYGANIALFRTAHWSGGLWGQRETITTIAGPIDEGGIQLMYSPKNW